MEKIKESLLTKLLSLLRTPFFKKRKKAELELLAVRLNTNITEIANALDVLVSRGEVIGVVDDARGVFYYLIDEEMKEFLKKCEEDSILEKDNILHLFPLPENMAYKLLGVLVSHGYAKIMIPGKKIIMKSAHENFKVEVLRYLSKHKKLNIKKYALSFGVPPAYIVMILSELEENGKLRGKLDEKKLMYHVELAGEI